MSKIVVFCENYLAIERTLYLATHNCHDSPVTVVISHNHDLFKFFQVINERVLHNSINLVYLEPYRSRRATAKGIKKVPHVVPDIIKERRYLKEIYNKHFAELEGCEIFFASRAFDGYPFYLLRKLRKRNRLVFIRTSRPDMPDLRKYIPTNILDLAKLIVAKLTYGRDIAIGQYPPIKGFLYMPDKFIEKEVDRFIDRLEMEEMIKGFDLSQFKIFDAANYDVVYFDQSLDRTDYIADGDTYRRELTEIFNRLSKYFPEKEIARKYHPNRDSGKTMIKVGDILPDFIPAEYLYSEKTKIYLGLFSVALAHVEKGLAVSLIDLISFKGDKTREKVREVVMAMSRSEILFPKSLDELEQILADVSKG